MSMFSDILLSYYHPDYLVDFFKISNELDISDFKIIQASYFGMVKLGDFKIKSIIFNNEDGNSLHIIIDYIDSLNNVVQKYLIK